MGGRGGRGGEGLATHAHDIYFMQDSLKHFVFV